MKRCPSSYVCGCRRLKHYGIPIRLGVSLLYRKCMGKMRGFKNPSRARVKQKNEKEVWWLYEQDSNTEIIPWTEKFFWRARERWESHCVVREGILMKRKMTTAKWCYIPLIPQPISSIILTSPYQSAIPCQPHETPPRQEHEIQLYTKAIYGSGTTRSWGWMNEMANKGNPMTTGHAYFKVSNS